MRNHPIYLLLLLITACAYTEEPHVNLRVGSTEPFTHLDSVPITIDISKEVARGRQLYENPQTYIASYINLESEGDFISNCRDLRIVNNKIYILDDQSDILCIYNMDGTIAKTINSKGRGPREYLGLQGMMFAPNSEVVIVDRLAPRALYFNLNGEFLRGEPLIMQGIGSTVLNDSVYIFITSVTGQNIGTQIAGKRLIACVKDSVIRADFDATPLQKKEQLERIAYFFNNEKSQKTLFTPNYCDTIYQISDDLSIYPKYHIISENSASKYRDDPSGYASTNSARNKELTFWGGFVVETPDCLYFTAVKNGEIKDVYYNRHTAQAEAVDYQPPFFMPKYYHDGQFVTYTPYSQMYDLYEKHKKGEVTIKDPKLLELASSIDDSSNGVITFFTLK